ncbi:MAG: DUF481 domain-containing protein, partial [Planctomycetales bacterium]
MSTWVILAWTCCVSVGWTLDESSVTLTGEITPLEPIVIPPEAPPELPEGGTIQWLPEAPPWADFWIPQRFELGGDFKRGTRESWTMLGSSRWEAEDDHRRRSLKAGGKYSQVERAKSANEWTVEQTYDRKDPETPRLVFSKFNVEYDEIEQLSFRSAISGGVGYSWLDQEERRLITRAGPTFTFTDFFGDSDIRVDPELLVELEGKIGWGAFEVE